MEASPKDSVYSRTCSCFSNISNIFLHLLGSTIRDIKIEFPSEEAIFKRLPSHSNQSHELVIIFPQAVAATSVRITVLSSTNERKFVRHEKDNGSDQNISNNINSKNCENGGTAHKCHMTTTTNASTTTAIHIRELITNNIYRSPRQGKDVI